MKIAAFTDDFEKIYEKEPRKVVVWGAGQGLRERWDELKKVDVICDINAREIKEFKGIPVVEPEILRQISEVYIIVSVKSKELFESICSLIKSYNLQVTIFHLFDNIAWGYRFLETKKSYIVNDYQNKLKVNIVNREPVWIFRKFADKLEYHLTKMGIEVLQSTDTRSDVDINHHIPYVCYAPYQNDTLMITHVDNNKKLEMLKKQLVIAGMGICMSKETMNKLISDGIPRNKLCYINPAQDNAMPIHKYVIGITNRCYDKADARKRATALLDIIEDVRPEFFRFIIMGAGWDEIVATMRIRGFEVEYFDDFNYDEYKKIMQQIDYYMYIGFDEGAMGYLDALAAGVGTIVTPQGYHLDVECGIDYPCSTVKQFREAFFDLQRKREKKILAVKEWTWENYALKHLEIWNYLLQRKPMHELFSHQLCYEDGIYSAYVEDNRI